LSFLDSIAETELRHIYLYWLERRQGRQIPRRGDIRPNEIDPQYLPSLFLYRREDNGRFRCLLVGTELVKIFQRDETGSYLDEILPPNLSASRLKLFARCVEERRPIYYAGPALMMMRERRRVGRLLLPLSSDGGKAEFVFGIATFGPILDCLPGGMPFPDTEEPASVITANDEDMLSVYT